MGRAAGQRARLKLSDGLGTQTASAYAQHLLDSLGVTPARPLDLPDEHPALTWARSGLMFLTGRADGPALMCPAPIAACADGALAALASLAPAGSFDGLRGSVLLAERAAIAGHSRNGAISAGGSCRLLETADGWIALNLAREDDRAMMPAWLEADVHADWDAVASLVRERPVEALVERGRLLGLAVAADEMPETPRGPLFRRARTAPQESSPLRDRHSRLHHSGARRCAPYQDGYAPLVVDLSSLWAGPLCGRLLRMAGATVIKVESIQRPDGARNGPPEFFARLNAGKQNVALDFATAGGRTELRALLARADIVIEGSRPRALRQLGISADEMVAANPALTWISVSGYGRGASCENWIAYGDDAGVAAGLSRLLVEATGEHVFVGDAIADPLTGLHAALAAYAGYRSGGAGMVSLALVDVARQCGQFDLPGSAADRRVRQREWTALVQQEGSEGA